MMKKPEDFLKPWHMGTHLRVPSKSYPCDEYQHDRVKTVFKISSHPCALDKSSLSTGSVDPSVLGIVLIDS